MVARAVARVNVEAFVAPAVHFERGPFGRGVRGRVVGVYHEGQVVHVAHVLVIRYVSKYVVLDRRVGLFDGSVGGAFVGQTVPMFESVLILQSFKEFVSELQAVIRLHDFGHALVANNLLEVLHDCHALPVFERHAPHEL